MLTTQQQKVVDINNITARQIEGGYVFLVHGREIRQSPSITSVGALKRGIGYVMSNSRR